MNTIRRLESQVRSYCRAFPRVFERAEGARLYDTDGRSWLDFFAGAGALNYGHNDPTLRQALMAYLAGGGVTHSLDMATDAKIALLEELERTILAPRGLRYRVMFPGPTGTNAVEAAIKLARKVTGRTTVVAFTNAFHGMTLGSLALTGNAEKRDGAGLPLSHVARMPFDGYVDSSLEYTEKLLTDPSSGVAPPAAFVVETVQAEGGVNVASMDWLRELASLAKRVGALLVVDDIQVGCGRTGPFFSFEEADLEPDMVCLSKSLSGFGLPMALTLIRPDLDQWSPGEHNGTFRGHNLAFVTARAALETFWRDDHLQRQVHAKAQTARERLDDLADTYGGEVRGRGLIAGLAMRSGRLASAVSSECFDRGLIIETCGPEGEVLKLLPPLTITEADLLQGLDILEQALEATTTLPRLQATGSRPQVNA